VIDPQDATLVGTAQSTARRMPADVSFEEFFSVERSSTAATASFAAGASFAATRHGPFRQPRLRATSCTWSTP
jgi:hypothetical protein